MKLRVIECNRSPGVAISCVYSMINIGYSAVDVCGYNIIKQDRHNNNNVSVRRRNVWRCLDVDKAFTCNNSKAFIKQPLKNRQNKGFNDTW